MATRADDEGRRLEGPASRGLLVARELLVVTEAMELARE